MRPRARTSHQDSAPPRCTTWMLRASRRFHWLRAKDDAFGDVLLGLAGGGLILTRFHAQVVDGELLFGFCGADTPGA